MENLANAYHSLGKFEEAKKLYEEVFIQRKNHFGEIHPETARAMNNLALSR